MAAQVPPRPAPLRALGCALLATACLAAALWLARHHPLWPLALAAAVPVAALAAAALPGLLLWLLPLLMPWIGFAPRTGWFVVEEFDLLLLALAAGGWAHQAWRALRPPGPGWRPAAARAGAGALAGSAAGASAASAAAGWRSPLAARLLQIAWVLAVALAAWRGVQDAGGLDWRTLGPADWFQAYRGPLNALRLAKPTLAVLLVLPLWLAALRRHPQGAADALTWGLAGTHAGVALQCVLERATYGALLDFSTDYRTTAGFWEMHVGGAALDGTLALTLPFALRLLLTARNPLRWGLAAATLLLGAYAGLTTFSRILLLAMPLAAGLTLWLHQRQALGGGSPPARPGPGGAAGTHAVPVAPHPPVGGLAAALLLLAGFGAAAAWAFPATGYRGLLALLGDAALLLMLAPALALAGRGGRQAATRARAGAGAAAAGARPGDARRALWLAAAVVGLLALAGVGLATGPLAAHWPEGVKPAYWAYAACVLPAAVLALAARGRTLWLGAALGLAWGGLAATVAVGAHWGAEPGRAAMLPLAALLALLLPALAAAPRAPWPAQRRWQAGTWVTMLATGAVVGVFGGGSYLADRLGQVGSDESGRLQHWRAAWVRMPDDTARVLGTGLGRFLAWAALDPSATGRPGDAQVLPGDDGRPVMRLINGRFGPNTGDLYRVTQVIERPLEPMVMTLELRSRGAALMQAEVCLKHLLYFLDCRIAEPKLPGDGQWHTLTLPLAGPPLAADEPGLPRRVLLGIGVQQGQEPVELRRISLRDAAGIERVANGDFSQHGARWFFSSDHYHMPWHAKNMAVHLLFEQGLLGLGLAAALLLLALGRSTLGAGRAQPLAPALAGALVGFATVGAIDSLLDMPRVATLAMLLLGLTLRLPAGSAPAAARPNLRPTPHTRAPDRPPHPPDP